MSTIETIAAELAALNLLVVAKADGFEWTRGELSSLFKAVQPEGNWKGYIYATVELLHERDVVGTGQAITFFTGSRATFHHLGSNLYRVSAAGYYATIGA
jgi:hypothetical protein